MTIRTYYLLTKPGIILGNLITTIGGFALASRGQIDFSLFFFTLLGLGAIIASACVFNNYIDRESDKKMARTKNRPLAQGLISHRSALLFATLLGLLGLAVLSFYTNLLATLIAFLGFFIYVVLYSLWKYRSSTATLVGSISGAIPPVVGYSAVSHQFDMGAALLFIILVLWQMPHFFSIAIYRFSDYAAASIPVLPIKKGNYIAKIHMLLYVIAFTIASLLFITLGYTGYAYLASALLFCFAWLALCIKGFKTPNDKLWARQMFRLSLIIIVVFCFMISVDSV